MSLYLKKFEACPYRNKCPYNSGTYGLCQGSLETRKSEFVCDLVTEAGSFVEGGFRDRNDSTGRIKLLLE